MPRAAIWLQWAIGWLPVWALFTTLMATAHQMPWVEAAPASLRLIACAAVLGLFVHRLTRARPWPHPFRWRFMLMHALAAAVFAVSWITLNSAVASLMHGHIALVIGPGIVPFLISGVWMYVMIAGVGYAHSAAAREAELKASAARSQLAALRAQLHPHFLFNALHTVVQLIPTDPRQATRAAEDLAQLLRTTLETPREHWTLGEEWSLVQRYLAIERLRMGERLQVVEAIEPSTLGMQLPSFALQTLVENAVRHGAAQSIENSSITIGARRDGDQLRIDVADRGPGADPQRLAMGPGTGLQRLRERLVALHGDSAHLSFEANQPHGVVASLRLPLASADD